MQPFSSESSPGIHSFVHGNPVRVISHSSLDLGGSTVLQEKLSLVGIAFFSGVGGPGWAELHVSVDSSLIKLGSLKALLVAFDDVLTVFAVFELLGHFVQSSRCFDSQLAGDSSIDETCSSTLVGDHVLSPSFLLRWCDSSLHFFQSILCLGSI